MIKSLISGVAAVALSMGVANAALVDEFDFEADGSTGTSIVLNNGEVYEIEISGAFFVGGPGDGMADAEYFNFNNPTDVVGQTDYGVQIDGNDVAWGTYDVTHVYTIQYVGTGAALDFSYFDTNYADNDGGFTVRIYDENPEVPLPAAAWFMGAGLAAYGASRRKKQS